MKEYNGNFEIKVEDKLKSDLKKDIVKYCTYGKWTKTQERKQFFLITFCAFFIISIIFFVFSRDKFDTESLICFVASILSFAVSIILIVMYWFISYKQNKVLEYVPKTIQKIYNLENNNLLHTVKILLKNNYDNKFIYECAYKFIKHEKKIDLEQRIKNLDYKLSQKIVENEQKKYKEKAYLIISQATDLLEKKSTENKEINVSKDSAENKEISVNKDESFYELKTKHGIKSNAYDNIISTLKSQNINEEEILYVLKERIKINPNQSDVNVEEKAKDILHKFYNKQEKLEKDRLFRKKYFKELEKKVIYFLNNKELITIIDNFVKSSEISGLEYRASIAILDDLKMKFEDVDFTNENTMKYTLKTSLRSSCHPLIKSVSKFDYRGNITHEFNRNQGIINSEDNKLGFLFNAIKNNGMIDKYKNDFKLIYYILLSERNRNIKLETLNNYESKYDLKNTTNDECIEKLYRISVGENVIKEIISLRTYIANDDLIYEDCFAGDKVDQVILKIKEKELLNKLSKNFVEPIISMSEIDLMSGSEFENFVAKLFRKMGYSTRVTKTSGDQGIDVVATKGDDIVAIQAKCYSDVVGNHAIMEAVAGMKYYNANICMVITNRTFTKSAIELANANNVKLWDRKTLKEKIDEVF